MAMTNKDDFRQMKYGMMVHWGLYSLPAGEWKGKRMTDIGEWIQSFFRIPNNEYEKLAAAFNPILFHADEWVKLALESGMKYMVMTSKHADGFAMFHSKADAYNIVDASPFGRDVVSELAESCYKHGMKFGLYYSQDIDFHHPHGGGFIQEHTVFGNSSWTNDWDYPDNSKKDYDIYYKEKAKPQIEEILRNYGELFMIWFDNPQTISKAQSQELFEMVKAYQPDCLINSRLGNGACDYRSLGDNEITDEFFGDDLVETPATLNDTWGYKAFDQNWKKADEIRRIKNHLNQRGINYLLNVGPDYLGRIPAPSVDILREVGKDLQQSGSSSE
jgi:alpha-L-fucosidase